MNVRKIAVPLTVVATLLLALALPAAAAAPDKAIGDVTWSNATLNVSMTFAAHESGKGEITTVLHRLDGTYVETWTGTVTCLVRDGDTATFGGTVTSTDFGNPAMDRFVVRVQDNGEGGDATDQINSNRTTNDNQGCTWFGFGLRPVTSGNLQVHYAK